MAKRHFTAEEVLDLVDSTEEEEFDNDEPMMGGVTMSSQILRTM